MFFLILMNILTNIHSIIINLLIVNKVLKIRVFFISDIKKIQYLTFLTFSIY